MKSFGFGKYKGIDWKEIPDSYFEWLINQKKIEIHEYEAELHRRTLADMAEGTWKERLVKAGFRALMKQHHPDAGGTDADAQQINAAYEALQKQK